MNTKLRAITVAFVITCAAAIVAGASSRVSANVPKSILVPDQSYSMGNLIFADTLALNETQSRTIYANKYHNFTHIKLIDGQTYKFTVESPAWNNGSFETDAGGYDEYPVLTPKRHSQYKRMALVGEIFSSDNNPTAYTGKHFLIGLGPRTWKASKTGYLVALANDCSASTSYATPACYADNSRVVTLKVKRTA